MRAIAHSEPAKPDLTFLYTVNITAGTFVDIGTGPRGDQLVVPITGGSFVGPILKGKQNTTHYLMTAVFTLLWNRQGASSRR
jgi:hypothetical protein